MSLPAGARLGPYEILDAIGAGGMGEVYRATDTRLGRAVAIKILPAHLSANPSARQRFEREARAVSSLSHPHICALFDVGHEDGRDFLVMEYLEGETLADRIAKGPIPTDETLRYAIQVADALDKAHRQGVIHRDLKPGNVMITRGGAKLLDFGLAKAAFIGVGDSSLTASPTLTSPLTAEGTIVGTFQYMAPEQLEGKEADARSDVFAFGALVHEMATGRKAFEGRTQAGLIASILKEQPAPISSIQPLVPPALDRLVQTCLAKDPDERRQSMHDVLLELKWIAEAGSQAGVPIPVAARRRTRARLAWGVAAVSSVAAAALAVTTCVLASRPERVVRAFIPPPEGMVYATTGPRPGPVAVSPDGTRLAFVIEDATGTPVLWVRHLDALSGQPLAGTEGAIYPFWSHDGRMIGFFAQGKLKKISAAGGPAQSLCDADNAKGGSWSRDGTILFAPTHESGIHRVSAAGGEPVPVTVLDEGRGDNSHRFPQFLPDQEHFLYFARTGGGEGNSGKSAVLIGSLGGGPERQVMNNESSAAFASGHLLFAREGALMAQLFDPDSFETTGEAFPIVDRVAGLASGAARAVFSASENGVLVYQSVGRDTASELKWFDASGAEIGALGGEPAEFYDIAISPDATQVAVAIEAGDTGASDLWIYDVERGISTRFTFDEAADANPVWSPDGARIVFSSNRKGRQNLYVNSVGGSETEELLLETDKNTWPTDWSADGRTIIYGTEGDIWALPLFDDREPFPVLQSEFSQWNGKLSPDGHWLVYSSMESGRAEVYVTSFPEPGRKWLVSKNGGFSVGWRDDGKEIFHAREDGLVATEVERDGASIRIGAERVILDAKPGGEGDITDDGQRVLLEIPLGVEEIVPLVLVVNWPAAL